MAHKARPGGREATALVESGIDARNFDVIDLDTGFTLSRRPRYSTSMWSSKLPRNPISPGQVYIAACELPDETDLLTWFAKSFRIDDVNALAGRQLGIRLRAVQTFWSAKGIDELFGAAETVRREFWYIPLMIESLAVAEFRVEL